MNGVYESETAPCGVANLANSLAISCDPRLAGDRFESHSRAPRINQRFPKFGTLPGGGGLAPGSETACFCAFVQSPIARVKCRRQRILPVICAPAGLPFHLPGGQSSGVSDDRFPRGRVPAGCCEFVPGFSARGPVAPICRNKAKAGHGQHYQRSWPIFGQAPLGNNMVSAWIAIRAKRGDRSMPPIGGMKFRKGRSTGSAMAPKRCAKGL